MIIAIRPHHPERRFTFARSKIGLVQKGRTDIPRSIVRLSVAHRPHSTRKANRPMGLDGVDDVLVDKIAAHPTTYAGMVRRWGHTSRGKTKDSASSFLGDSRPCAVLRWTLRSGRRCQIWAHPVRRFRRALKLTKDPHLRSALCLWRWYPVLRAGLRSWPLVHRERPSLEHRRGPVRAPAWWWSVVVGSRWLLVPKGEVPVVHGDVKRSEDVHT